MKICCISDTHGKHHKLDLSQYPADTLVHAGDFTRSAWSKTGVITFLEWFNAQDFKYKILIAGNHEMIVEAAPEWFSKVLKEFPGITYLENSSITIGDMKFFGSPCSNTFGNWAFMHGEEGLREIYKEIPNDTNILITHGPSYGHLDKVDNAYGRDPHVGSKALAKRKKELTELSVHISGHIHECYGTEEVDGYINVCPSILNLQYKAVNDPIIIEI